MGSEEDRLIDQRTCSLCQHYFSVSTFESLLREKIGPSFDGTHHPAGNPSLCPECRYQRRLANRNEWFLYHRKCDATDKQVLSIYSRDNPHTVYAQDYWWSDAWDPLQYGRDFDFSKTFFEQFADFRLLVPRICITNTNSDNCLYTNQASHNKDCYLVVASNFSERCFYGNWYQKCKNCFDCYVLTESENCYECLNGTKLSHCAFLRDCDHCSHSWFSRNCSNCNHIFGCHDLDGKDFHVHNESVTEEEWRHLFEPGGVSRSTMREELENMYMPEDLRPERYYQGKGNQLFSGNDLENCVETFNAFHCRDCLRNVHCQDVIDSEECLDLTETASTCKCAELEGTAFASDAFVVNKSWTVKSISYSELCFDSERLFGCIGIKNGSHCILNKQYAVDEYEKLANRIAQHMEETGEWGEFFPTEISPFGYGESVAQEYFPLSRAEVLSRGWKWQEIADRSKQYLGPKVELPDSIGGAEDQVLHSILMCEKSEQPYRIIAEELAFCRQMGIPLPKRAVHQRRADRYALRNPRKLWQRPCMSCSAVLESSFDPKSQAVVFCEECFQRHLGHPGHGI